MSLADDIRTALEEAGTAEEKGDPRAASQRYRQAAGLMRAFAEQAISLDARDRRLDKASSYDRRAESLLNGRTPGAPRSAAPASETGAAAPEDDYLAQVKHLVHRSKIGWEDIGGLDDVKEEILLTYGIALAGKPRDTQISSWRNILLYGPPGTGKTLLAAATSRHLHATFFNVKASNLLSKYYGESTKLVSALYQAARSAADSALAVVFIDEFDALCRRRGEAGESGADRKILSTLLSELDGLAEKGEDRAVLTIGATNQPFDLDDALLSRFQKRIYIPLPDPAARRRILEIHLTERGIPVAADWDRIVARTECFSGRDLERLSAEVTSTMIREANPDVTRLVKTGLSEITSYVLRVRPLTDQDFDRALAGVRVDAARLRELESRLRTFASNN